MSKIAVIGAGPMGLATAYELTKHNHQVDLYEFDDRLGGMSAHFDFDGLSIERYYHFVCRPDEPLFELLHELGMADKLHWVDTKMGYYYHGHLHRWGDPISLLTFPHLNLISRLRYGAHMFFASKRDKDNWRDLDGIDAVTWLKKGSGKKAYDVLWDRLFRLKFHDYTDNLSAAWIWARIRRIGQSRRSIFQESLGYIQGGSQTLLNELARRIGQQGGHIHLSTPVQNVRIENDRVTGIELNNGVRKYDQVISTIPLQYIPRLMPDLPQEQLERYRQVQNIGVVCLIYKLKKPVTDNFWLNISDPDFDIPGIIEMSNLRPLPDNIVYVPYYMPQSHPKFSWNDEAIINEATGYLKKLNPELGDEDILSVNASRYAYAQPICQPGFASLLPPIRGKVENLLIADTSYYYPEDRSIAESVQLGKQLAMMAQS
ncbi:NAD(P)/FAD-dependent oxidoreductase [Thiohalophilus sp.]|uniref:NAD(P)/FAD-dependent oxidoreductase n=1 Tax=Thiohalophilus sp. TaxID=3028392 RepID=UPI0039747A0F